VLFKKCGASTTPLPHGIPPRAGRRGQTGSADCAHRFLMACVIETHRPKGDAKGGGGGGGGGPAILGVWNGGQKKKKGEAHFNFSGQANSREEPYAFICCGKTALASTWSRLQNHRSLIKQRWALHPVAIVKVSLSSALLHGGVASYQALVFASHPWGLTGPFEPTGCGGLW